MNNIEVQTLTDIYLERSVLLTKQSEDCKSYELSQLMLVFAAEYRELAIRLSRLL